MAERANSFAATCGVGRRLEYCLGGKLPLALAAARRLPRTGKREQVSKGGVVRRLPVGQDGRVYLPPRHDAPLARRPANHWHVTGRSVCLGR
jgi:hypothetical protein